MNLSPKQRLKLRIKFGGFCAYCGIELPFKGWHADHVISVHRIAGNLRRPLNDRLNNLYPACAACNLDKHSMCLESWRKVLANKVNVCRYDSAFRHAERFGLIVEVKKPIVFWFEQFQEVDLVLQYYERNECTQLTEEVQH